MNFQEYRQYDALGLAELIRKREILSSEILELAIGRAEAVNPKINAIIYPFYERARRQVAVTSPETPFAGVPFLLKDLAIELAGTPFSQGCSALRGNESARTSEMVRRLEESGLVFLGKTNTSEFGLAPYTEPQAFGPTHNPWDLSRTPGGSSGGSAAAVAAGIVPMATGSDGGGSIRIPASCCGLFGLKPSRGRVSMGPQHAEAWQGAIMENCLSRSVRDSAAHLDVIRGNMPGDPFPVHTPKRPYLEEVDRTPDTLHIGFAVDHPLGHQVDPDCVEAVRKTAALLENLGHQVEEVPFPFQRRDLAEAFIIMIMGETAATVTELEKHLGRPGTRRDVEPNTWAIALLGRSVSAEQFVMALRRWNEVARRMGEFHQQYDILLTPVTAKPPFQTGHLQPTRTERLLTNFVNRFNLGWLAKSNIDLLAEKVFSYTPFTPLANITGQPSMSVPLHWTKEGLPVGSMCTAPMGREDMLYRLAGQLERAQPWFEKIPALDKTSNAPITQ